MRERKYKVYYQDGDKKIKFSKVFTLDQLINYDHWDQISDSPLMRGYSVKCMCDYTGLKDKNGKEIYEGDIVRSEDDMNGSFDTICKVDELCPYNGYQLSFHYDNGHNGGVECHAMLDGKLCEVIGNIYENPDLI